MSSGSSNTSYYSRVSQSGNQVKYSYHIKNQMDSRQQTETIKIVQEKFNFTLLSDRSWRADAPYIGPYTFRSYVQKVYNWEVLDPVEREKLVSILKAMEPILAGMNLVDPITVSTKKIWSDIVKDKNRTPLLVTGEKVYKLTLVEDISDRPVKPTEALQDEVSQQLAYNTLMYEERLEEERRELNEKMDAYSLDIEDFQQGFSSFILNENHRREKCLAKSVTFQPTHIIFSDGKTKRIKPEESLKMKQDILIVYKSKGGIYTWTPTSKWNTYSDRGATLPHSYSGGNMCTGSYSAPYNATYEEAKAILNKIEGEIQIINMRSLAGGSIIYEGQLMSLHTLDIKKICVEDSEQTTLNIENGEVF